MRTIAIALALLALGAPAARAEETAPGVTDLSAARAGNIEVGDIVEALAVPRGTRIQAAAPPTVRLPVYFESNSAKLTPEAETLLQKVSVALKSNELGTFRFAIEGHTDDVGGDGYNQSLSERRANAVKAYLLAQGVSEERLRARGLGEAKPVAPNQDDSGRQRNRRVEVVNLGEK